MKWDCGTVGLIIASCNGYCININSPYSCQTPNDLLIRHKNEAFRSEILPHRGFQAVISKPPTQPGQFFDGGGGPRHRPSHQNPQSNSANSLEIDTLLGRPQLHQFHFSELNPSWVVGLSLLVIKEGEGIMVGCRQPPGASLNFLTQGRRPTYF